MSERIANIIILTEDQEQQNLIRRYLLRAGQSPRCFRFEPLPGDLMCGSQFVRERFRDQVLACRGILGRKAACLLIVMTDADNCTVKERELTLLNQLTQYGVAALALDEPIIIFIPKWQVETWIKCLLGALVLEEDRKTDQPPVDATQIRLAAENLFNWARPGAPVSDSCVPSLRASLPHWRRIG